MLRQTHESRDVKVWLLCCEKTCSSSWLFFHIGRSPHSDNPFIILDKDKLTKYKTPFLNDDFIDFGQKMIQTHLYESTCLESWVHFHYPHSGVATLLPQSRNSLNRNRLKKWSRLTDLKSNTSGHYLPHTTDIIHKRRNCGTWWTFLWAGQSDPKSSTAHYLQRTAGLTSQRWGQSSWPHYKKEIARDFFFFCIICISLTAFN